MTAPETSRGETFGVPCSIVPEDGLALRWLIREDGVSGVGLVCEESGQRSGVVLSIADARRVAAALLNAADALDGTTPLVFLPERTRRDTPPRRRLFGG